MPEARRLLDEVVAEPQHVATMSAALEEAWDQISERFADAPSEVTGIARATLANGIMRGFREGATDLLPLKHWGLAALRTRFPERFPSAE